MSSSPILFPQVSVPKVNGTEEARAPGQSKVVPGEFGKVFDSVNQTDLSKVQEPIRFSAHAYQRLKERNIPLDAKLVNQLRTAVDKAEAKGIQDTLVLMDNAALIVNTKNRIVITAMDREAVTGNVFTNIDGAVIL